MIHPSAKRNGRKLIVCYLRKLEKTQKMMVIYYYYIFHTFSYIFFFFLKLSLSLSYSIFIYQSGAFTQRDKVPLCPFGQGSYTNPDVGFRSVSVGVAPGYNDPFLNHNRKKPKSLKNTSQRRESSKTTSRIVVPTCLCSPSVLGSTKSKAQNIEECQIYCSQLSGFSELTKKEKKNRDQAVEWLNKNVLKLSPANKVITPRVSETRSLLSPHLSSRSVPPDLRLIATCGNQEESNKKNKAAANDDSNQNPAKKSKSSESGNGGVNLNPGGGGGGGKGDDEDDDDEDNDHGGGDTKQPKKKQKKAKNLSDEELRNLFPPVWNDVFDFVIPTTDQKFFRPDGTEIVDFLDVSFFFFPLHFINYI